MKTGHLFAWPRQGEVMNEDKEKMLKLTTDQIESKFGKGSIMTLGEGGADLNIGVIPTGALPLDAALGIGGVPRGRIVEIYGPESSGKTTLALADPRRGPGAGRRSSPSSTPSTPSIPFTPRALGRRHRRGAHLPARHRRAGAGDHASMLVRSGAIDVRRRRLCGGARCPAAEIEGEMGETTVGLSGAAHVPGPAQAGRVAVEDRTTIVHLHQPAAREDRRHVRQPGDDAPAAAR